MNVRLAKASDRGHVLALLNQLGEIVNERVRYDSDNVRAHELGKINYDDAMRRADRKVFVVEDGGRILAVATFFILTDFITGRPFAHVDDFIVEKTRRRQGIGTRLMTYIKNYAKKHGIFTIELTSSLSLVDAHRFYERQGGVFSRKVMKFEL